MKYGRTFARFRKTHLDRLRFRKTHLDRLIRSKLVQVIENFRRADARRASARAPLRHFPQLGVQASFDLTEDEHSTAAADVECVLPLVDEDEPSTVAADVKCVLPFVPPHLRRYMVDGDQSLDGILARVEESPWGQELETQTQS